MFFKHSNYGSSRPEVFCKKSVVRNFTKYTRKHLYQSLFFNNVAGLWPATLLKKRLWHRCFLVNFAKFPRTPFLTEHFWWLLLFSWHISNANEICEITNAFLQAIWKSYTQYLRIYYAHSYSLIKSFDRAMKSISQDCQVIQISFWWTWKNLSLYLKNLILL